MSAIVRDMLRNYYTLDDSSRFDLDRAIEILVSRDVFDHDHLIILRLTIGAVPQAEIAKAVGVTRPTLQKSTSKICAEIANELGEEYQDIKLLKEVESRLGRPLTKQEEAFCYKVLKAGHPIGSLSILDLKGGEDGRDSDKNKG
uniref:Uncharacterized protein n=1 Tax=viral metagenome TaxID=1070528 RepID=A0A6M3L7S9_9ZZZZ